MTKRIGDFTWFTQDLKICLGIVVIFGAVVLIIGAFVGIAPVVPGEQVSMALGVSAAVPILAAVVIYSGLQLVRSRTSGGSLRDLTPHILHDMVLLAAFVLICYFHFNLKMWVPLINDTLWDDAYFATDEAVRPLVDWSMAISSGVRNLIGDTVRWYQLVFHGLLIISFSMLALDRTEIFGRYAVAILLVLSLGGLSYIIAPGLGPFLYEAGSSPGASEAQAGMHGAYQFVQQEGAPWIVANGSLYFTGALGAMPSLHTTYACVVSWYMVKARAPLAIPCVLLSVWILIDAVALRWHYVIDLPFGALLAVACIMLADRLVKSDEDQKPNI